MPHTEIVAPSRGVIPARVCTRRPVYAPRRPEWGSVLMKVIRRLVRHGNSSHVSLPPRVLEFLGWRPGDPLCVEITMRKTIEIRPPDVSDLRATTQPMTLDDSLPVAAK